MLDELISLQYGFDTLSISGSYGGHGQHTTDQGQCQRSGVSSPQVSKCCLKNSGCNDFFADGLNTIIFAKHFEWSRYNIQFVIHKYSDC